MVSEERRRSTKPLVLIITGDGLNCERETAWAFSLAGADCELVHIGDILSRVRRLADYAALAFIGGFSNGDHLGAGTVQATRFRHSLREDLRRFIAGGGPIIGICNGFQTLVKMGILPGVLPGTRADAEGWRRNATIMVNDSGRFEDRWVHLAVASRKSPFLARGPERLRMPVAHAEGKFVARDAATLARLEAGGQVALRYVDPQGRPGGFPWNPNGSMGDVAAITDPSGRVLGLMPHPERNALPGHDPRPVRAASPGSPDGLGFFASAVETLRREL